MGESWVILLAWGAVYSGGDLPAGLEDRPGFAEAVQMIAVQEEWTAPGHSLSLCAAREARWECEGMPRLWVFGVLPSKAWVDEQRRFADRHIEWLDDQIALAPPGGRRVVLEEWRAEAVALEGVYATLSDAQYQISSPPCVRAARVALGRLEQAIGRKALERGLLPPVVPVWRFRRVP